MKPEQTDHAATPQSEGAWPEDLHVALEDGRVAEIAWGDEPPPPGSRRYVPADQPQRSVLKEIEKALVCVYPGCEVGPLQPGGGYLERVNPKGEPFEGACPDHYEAVINDDVPEEAPDA